MICIFDVLLNYEKLITLEENLLEFLVSSGT